MKHNVAMKVTVIYSELSCASYVMSQSKLWSFIQSCCALVMAERAWSFVRRWWMAALASDPMQVYEARKFSSIAVYIYTRLSWDMDWISGDNAMSEYKTVFSWYEMLRLRDSDVRIGTHHTLICRYPFDLDIKVEEIRVKNYPCRDNDLSGLRTQIDLQQHHPRQASYHWFTVSEMVCGIRMPFWNW